MKYVIFFAGLIGAGKTTLARGVANKIGAFYIDVDEIKKQEYPKEPDYEFRIKNNIPFPDRVRERVFERVLEHISELSVKYDTVIIDETFHKKKLRNALFEAASKICDRTLVVLITTNEDVLRSRLQKPREGHILKDSIGMYQSLKKVFEDFDNPDIVFENNQNDIESSIASLTSVVEIKLRTTNLAVADTREW